MILLLLAFINSGINSMEILIDLFIELSQGNPELSIKA